MINLVGLSWAVAGLLLSGCSPGFAQGQLANLPQYNPSQQTKCQVSASHLDPLVVEWPSADRARLEALAHDRSVVVRYLGCEVQVLPTCRASGKYRYVGTTTKQSIEHIRNADDLYAKLPLGAASLEGTLNRKQELRVTMNIVGRYERAESTVSASRLEGDCDGATHVVHALIAGAFEFSAGAEGTAGGGVSAFGAGAGVKAESAHEVLTRDGIEEACQKAAPGDASPPAGCGALIRMELVAIPEIAERTAAEHARRQASYDSERDSARTRRTIGYILSASGVLAGAASGTFGYLGTRQNDAIRQGGFDTPQSLQDAASTGKTYNLGAYVSLGVAVVLLGVGTPLVLLNPEPARQDASASPIRYNVAKLKPSGGLLP